MSEWYIPRGYQSRSRGSGRGSSTLGWNAWGSKSLYPDESKITYPSGTYDLSGRYIDIPGNNYLEEPFWLVSRVRPVAVVDASNGPRTDASAGTSGFYVQVLQQGDAMNPEITSIDARLSTPEEIDGTYFILYDDAGSVAFWFDVDANGTPEPAHGAMRSVKIDTVTQFDIGLTIVERINVAIENDAKFLLQNGSGGVDFALDPYETHRCFELIVENASSSSLERGYDCTFQPSAEPDDLGFPPSEGVKVSNGPRPPPRQKEYAADRWVGLEGEMIKASPLNGLVTPTTLGADPLTTGAAASSVVTVTHNAHGYIGGETIVMSGVEEFDGIRDKDVNKHHVITFVDANTYTIDVSPSIINVGGVSGGGSNVNVNDPLQSDCNGRIVFIETDGTDYKIRVQNAEAAGAVGVVFYPDNGDNIYTILRGYYFDGNLNDTEIPTVLMRLRDQAVALTGPMPDSAPTSFSGHINDGSNIGIVDGQWLFGVTRDDVADRALAESSVNAAAPKCGYVSHNDYAFSSRGHIDRWDWVFEDEIQGTSFATPAWASLLAAARVYEFFNAKQVKHFIYDDRNAIGGGSTFTAALFALIGGKRESNYTSAIRFHGFDPNGFVKLTTSDNLNKYQEDCGVLESIVSDYVRSIDPQKLRDELVPLGFPENGFFNGSLASNPGPKTIIWYTNATVISAPQVAYLSVKLQSLDTTEFDGDFGDDTCFVGYGCYYRPFATGGNYVSYINWYGRNRAGEEEFVNPPIPFSDRWESTDTLAYIQGSDNSSFPSTGGVVKMHGQDFSRAHQPQFIWDMNADIFFQDIGFTTGNDDLRKVHIVDANLGTRADIAPGDSGFAVSVARQGEARLKEASLVDCTGVDGSGLGGKYFTMADDAGAVYVWYNTGASADPAPGGRGIVVNITTADRDDEVAAKTAAALEADSKFNAWAQTVDPCATGGKPFVARRHSDVNYCDVNTLRDTVMDRTFVILSDIVADSANVKAMHFYKDDGYGDLL
jgi:hypothetical protein